MSEKIIGWGVIGATSRVAGESVIPAICKCPRTALCAVASRDQASAAQIAAQVGPSVKAYGDYDSLLADPQVNVVYLPLPNNLHAGWAIEAMNNGKHVLCEQPLALNAVEAQEMRETAEENGVILSEGFMYRYHPLQEEVFGRVARGEIGTVSLVRASYSFVQTEAADYRRDPGMGGGALLDVGGYGVHIARTVFGMEPVSVTGKSMRDGDDGIDTSTTAQLDFPNGGTALIDCSFAQTFRASYEIVGERGAISVPLFSPPPDKASEYLLSLNGQEPQTISVPAADMFEAEICAMSEKVGGGSGFLLSVADGVNNMRVLDAIALSARMGVKTMIGD